MITEEMMAKAVAAAREAAESVDIQDPYNIAYTGYDRLSSEAQMDMDERFEDYNNEAWESVLRAALGELGL